jgi:hypothetical protein
MTAQPPRAPCPTEAELAPLAEAVAAVLVAAVRAHPERFVEPAREGAAGTPAGCAKPRPVASAAPRRPSRGRAVPRTETA